MLLVSMSVMRSVVKSMQLADATISAFAAEAANFKRLEVPEEPE